MPRLLIMEDELPVLHAIADVLRNAGAEVRTASTLHDFFAELDLADRDTKPFDAYLLDYWTGPRHHPVPGTEAYYSIRLQCGSQAPILGVTSDLTMWQRVLDAEKDPNLHIAEKTLTGNLMHWPQAFVLSTLTTRLKLLQPTTGAPR